MTGKNYLHGTKVRLRPLEPEDLDFIYRVENTPANWSVTDCTVPYSRFAVRQYLRDTQCDLFADKQLRLVIVRCEDNLQVGTIDIFNYQPLHAHGEVGILVEQAYQGRGYAREALTLLCDYAFGYLSFRQLAARVLVGNEISLKLFRSCGFVPCGVLKAWWCVDGCYEDVMMLQRLREEASPSE